MSRPRRALRSRRLYRFGAAVALVSFGFGSWRFFVERDVIGGVFWQLIFPLLMFRVCLTLYRRSSDA